MAGSDAAESDGRTDLSRDSAADDGKAEDGAAGDDTSVNSRADVSDTRDAESTTAPGSDQPAVDRSAVDQPGDRDGSTDRAEEPAADTVQSTAPQVEPAGAHALTDPAPTEDPQVDRTAAPAAAEADSALVDTEDRAGPPAGPGATADRDVDGRPQPVPGVGADGSAPQAAPAEQSRGGSHADSVADEHQRAGLRELGFQGRASEEPGLTSDEFDGARTPWNPFKRPQ
jgi:hypothetical protein